MISGFCGETEAEHEDTVRLMTQLRFDHAFMYLFSLREETYAWRHLRDDVTPAEKQRRLEAVQAAFYAALRGKVAGEAGRRQLVLVEGESRRRGPGRRPGRGRTAGNRGGGFAGRRGGRGGGRGEGAAGRGRAGGGGGGGGLRGVSRDDAWDGDERGEAAVQDDAAGVCGEGEGVSLLECLFEWCMGLIDMID